jgi:hypothetical protein
MDINTRRQKSVGGLSVSSLMISVGSTDEPVAVRSASHLSRNALVPKSWSKHTMSRREQWQKAKII